MADIVMFPEELTALRQELAHAAHVDIRAAYLEVNTHPDLPSQIGVIAGLLEIAVQGYFDQEGVLRLAKTVTQKLVEKRGSDAVWKMPEKRTIIPPELGDIVL